MGFLDDYLIGHRVEFISESKASFAEVLALLFFALLYAPFVVVDVLQAVAGGEIETGSLLFWNLKS